MTLCPIHARQAMTELREPTGVCHPEESWIGGSGQTVHCEFAINPAGVRSWFLSKEERRLANKARSRYNAALDGETPQSEGFRQAWEGAEAREMLAIQSALEGDA